MEEKLIFLHYIISQNDDSLAHQILYEQKKNKWPGLVQECNKFIEDMHILDPFQTSLSKNEWKRIVKKALNKANSDELKEEITTKYKKLKDYIKNLSLQHARTKFKFRSSMKEHVKMNQKNNIE